MPLWKCVKAQRTFHQSSRTKNDGLQRKFDIEVDVLKSLFKASQQKKKNSSSINLLSRVTTLCQWQTRGVCASGASFVDLFSSNLRLSIFNFRRSMSSSFHVSARGKQRCRRLTAASVRHKSFSPHPFAIAIAWKLLIIGALILFNV